MEDRTGAPDRRLPADPLVRFTCGAILTALGILAATYGAGVVLPVVEAFILWFILNRLARAVQQIPFVGARIGFAGALALSIILVTAISLLALFSGVRGVLNAGPQAVNLQASFDPIIAQIAEFFGMERADVLNRTFNAIGLENLLQQLVLGLLGLLNQFGVIALFVAFLFADQALFPAKLRALFPNPSRRARVEAVLGALGRGIGSYLWVMTCVSALTALLSYVAMVVLGLDYAVFCAVMVFFLNYIPTIGSILGTVLPVAFGLVQFDDMSAVLVLLIVLGAIQFTIGNVVFPRMAGNSLNLSLFVTILCLFFWGALWGVTGMFLAVPLTAMIVIILAQFEATRPIAILLSKTGNLDATDGNAPDAEIRG
ncbi:MAG: AI-2E family transporter [Pseudomonadota bacterium]